MRKINLNKTLGIIGGGQLGKMIGLAAANLGIKLFFYDPDPEAPSKIISNYFYNYNYDNKKKLLEFYERCDFITYEFENIPIKSLNLLNNKKKIYPNVSTLRISQDRYLEKNFISNLGIKVAKNKNIKNFSDIESFLKQNSGAGLIKTRRLGYDGKGQKKVELENLKKKKFNIEPNLFIIEELVDFYKEISVIAFRNRDGIVKTYEPSENLHKEGILRETIYPVSLKEGIIKKAKKIAKKIISELNVVGILAIEMFVIKNGEIIVNEIAPRPHNSGHWTLDACNISQFDALVRIIFDLPIPKIMYAKKCKMINLLGENLEDYINSLKKKNHQVYLYGKTKVKMKRKMGHINIFDREV